MARTCLASRSRNDQTRVAPAPGSPLRAVFARWGGGSPAGACFLKGDTLAGKSACALLYRLQKNKTLPLSRNQESRGEYLDRGVMTSQGGTALKHVADRLGKIFAREWFLEQDRAHRDLLL